VTDGDPRVAENCTNKYDDDALQPADPEAVIPWENALGRLSGANTRRHGFGGSSSTDR
jgi:hypothetical protein